MDERYFYQGTSVSVTQSKFVAGGKTYPISTITSAIVRVVKPSKVFPLAVILAGPVLYLLNIPIIIVIVCILAGIGLLFYPKKKRYTVQITVAGKQTGGLTSSDRAYIQIVVDAINTAIACKS